MASLTDPVAWRYFYQGQWLLTTHKNEADYAATQRDVSAIEPLYAERSLVDRPSPSNALEDQSQALRQSDAAASAETERWQHIANEWADLATNGLQALRNVRDGISTTEQALSDLAFDTHAVRIRAMGAAVPQQHSEPHDPKE